MTDRVQDPVDCRAFDRFLYAFQDGELSEADRGRMRDHAGTCRECARRLEIEASFLRGLQGRLERVAAPPGLETRIRAALEERAPHSAPAVLAWAGRPWFAATAAAVLLIGLLVGLPRFRPASPATTGGAHLVRQQGTIVDYECDVAGIPVNLQRNCPEPVHLNALKLADGSYVHFSLDGQAARRLAGDRGLRGTHVVVSGEYLPGIHALKVEEYERLPSAETATWRPPIPQTAY